jgi:hypothetical protein
MITFIAPASSTYFSIDTTYTVDVNPEVSKQVSMLEYNAKDFPLEQARADGINIVKETITFRLINLPIAEVYALDGYFNELKATTPIDLVFPGTNNVTAAVAVTNGLIIGRRYKILTAGSINWTSLGASASTIGTAFYYNGTTSTGSGGVVSNVVKKTLIQNWSVDVPNSKFGAISANGKLVRL